MKGVRNRDAPRTDRVPRNTVVAVVEQVHAAGCCSARSNRPTISSMLQTWFDRPASIAGVAFRVGLRLDVYAALPPVHFHFLPISTYWYACISSG
jgi:hypothetical protein